MPSALRTKAACAKSVREEFDAELWAKDAWADLEREFRAATREIAEIAADALYGPAIADLEREIAKERARVELEQVR